MKIKKLSNVILLIILLLVTILPIFTNQLVRINYFQAISDATNHLITQNLILSSIGVVIYSIIIFGFGKLTLSDIWISKKKIKEAIIPVIMIWGIVQIIILVYTFFTTKEFVFVQDISSRIGRILGQLFGNALLEEFIFRGVFFLQVYLIIRKYKTNKLAIIIAMISSQLLFALVHIPNRLLIKSFHGLVPDLFLIFITGIIITLIYIRTNNLAFVIGGHALINSRINIIETTFPWQVATILIFILVAVFWTKIKPSFKVLNLWKDGVDITPPSHDCSV